MSSTDPSRAKAAPWGDPLDLALRLSLLTLLWNPGMRWSERVPVLLLAAAGFLFPAVARRPGLWLALTIATGLRLYTSWPLSDNHAYLTALWCLAISAALLAADPRLALATQGRLLVGLTFAFASLWKLALSPDFLDGTFFRVTLLTDGRFANLAVLLGGMSWEAFEANDAAVSAYHQGGVAWAASGFREPAASIRLAHGLTAATAVLEAALAVSFLWPGRGWLHRLRDPLLLFFCVTTYAFAVVAGFGWLVLAMGFAQCDPERRGLRAGYIAAFLLVLVYRAVPWSDALVEALHG